MENFVIQQGLTVGTTYIDAASGDLDTSGNITVTAPGMFYGNITFPDGSTQTTAGGGGGGGGGVADTIINQANSATIIADTANTPDTIVLRDANGDFSAGTITATVTNARYADLAEKYSADAFYAPGTVLCFGGSAEVTLCVEDGCRKVAGVVSTNPAHIMNSGLTGVTATVALQGRAPVNVIGNVNKGDMMVAAGNGFARAEANPSIGQVIGKSLEVFSGTSGIIEVVVGRV